MARWIGSVGVGILSVLCCGAGNAQQMLAAPEIASKPTVLLALPAIPTQDIEAHLRQAALKVLPADFVLETNNNWGHQAHIPSIQGVTLIQVMRNHGDWEKARVVVRDLPKNLRFRVGDVYSVADNRITFTVRIATPAHVELHKQIWQNGIEVYASRVRARFQLSANVTLEAVLAPAAKGEPAADRLGSFQIVHATYSCHDFVVENVNGLGGDFARYTGGAMERTFKPWQPVALGEFQKSIDRSVQAASENHETRLALSKLLLQASAARETFLITQDVTAANSFPPSTTRPTVVVVPTVVPAPVQLFFGSFMMEIPIAVHPEHLPPPAVHANRYEHPGLANHSIHYQRSTHASHSTPSHSHSEPVRKR